MIQDNMNFVLRESSQMTKKFAMNLNSISIDETNKSLIKSSD